MNRHQVRPRLVAVVTESCTGCHACVDYCLVDCIDEAPSGASGAPPIQIREEECIGCQVCAKVCDQLALHAIRLVPAAEVRASKDLRTLAEVA
ncbi:MAG: ferredoxin family protein [Candidatus Methylomirabilales bacterium]